MKILFAASEAAPFIKTGGLGDVAFALPTELAKDPDTEVCIFLPYYQSIKINKKLDITFVKSFAVELSWRRLHCGLFKAITENDGAKLTYYFIDNEYYFNRPAPYGYYDDGERFAFFSKAILETLLHIDFMPDTIHCNDWQTALIPLFLKASYSNLENMADIKTLFTIHNIEYQGKVPEEFFDEVLGVNRYWFNAMHFDNCINFMKGAIVLADRVSTVSRTYAHEIKHSYFGHGLENVLTEYGYKLRGVVNGIDTNLYNAQKDTKIYQNFESGDLKGKTQNKLALQKELGLPVNPDIPMIGMITRLVSHKGLDLVEFVASEIMAMNVQLVIIGTGDKKFEDLFKKLACENPTKMSANILFDPVLANKLYAGSDLFLMPSQSEPCGLSQLISMRYGTLPIVRETGGLFDTVPAINTDTLEGRGFTFKLFNAHDMLHSIQNAVNFWYDKDKLEVVVGNIMDYDCSWTAPVAEYREMY